MNAHTRERLIATAEQDVRRDFELEDNWYGDTYPDDVYNHDDFNSVKQVFMDLLTFRVVSTRNTKGFTEEYDEGEFSDYNDAIKHRDYLLGQLTKAEAKYNTVEIETVVY